MRFNNLYKLQQKKRIRKKWQRIAKRVLKYSRLSKRQRIQSRWQTFAREIRIRNNLRVLDSFIRLIIIIFLLRIEKELDLI